MGLGVTVLGVLVGCNVHMFHVCVPYGGSGVHLVGAAMMKNTRSVAVINATFTFFMVMLHSVYTFLVVFL